MNPALQAFLVRLGIVIAKKLHYGPLHDWAEAARKRIEKYDKEHGKTDSVTRLSK